MKDVLTAGQTVTVRVLSVDKGAGRIALTMLTADEEAARADRVSGGGGGGGGGRAEREDGDDAPGGGDRRRGGGDRAGGGRAEREDGDDAPGGGDRRRGGGDRAGGGGGERRRSGPPPAEITLSKGDVVDAVVSRVLPYGAFLDVGDGVAGLLHSEQMGDDPPTLTEGAKLSVTVLSVDSKRRRVDLTLRTAEELATEDEIAERGMTAGGDVPPSASPFGAALARAGLSVSDFRVAAAPTRADAVASGEPVPAKASATPAAVKAAPAQEAKTGKPAADKAAVPAATGGVSAAAVKALRDKSGAGMMDCKKALTECGGDVDAAADFLRKKGLASADKKASRVAAEGEVAAYIHAGSRLGVLVEVNCETDFVARGDTFKELVADLAMQVAAFPDVTVVSVDNVPADVVAKETELESQKEDILSKPEAMRPKIVEGRVSKNLKTMALLEQPYIKDSTKTVDTAIREAVATLGEKISVRRFERYELGAGIEKKTADLAADVAEQTAALEAAAAAKKAAPKEEEAADDSAKASALAVAVSAATVKTLRDKSGAGMMDCKKALAECGGDVDKAADFLRKKGLASADKKASRVAAEGLVGSYIHAGSALGVLIEVNCETDFVARGDAFGELVADLAMQVAACPGVSVVSVDDVPAAELARERELESQKEDILSKPENIRAKIVDGRVAKIASERALLEQAFIKDIGKTVGDVVRAATAALGENIVVRRFARYNLGEGIEKAETDFAAEVAAQTGGKA